MRGPQSLTIISDMSEYIGHYKIEKKLGSGGMGEVYLAYDTRLNRNVALKILLSHVRNEESIRRFRTEATVASNLNHASICVIHDIGETGDGRPYIAMEYVEGETLSARITRSPISLEEVLEIAIAITEALQEAHGKGVVHRDIKPSNVMITPRGGMKVLDFGLAKIMDEFRSPSQQHLTETQPGMIFGTIAYMSPEQAMGKAVDHRSDLFSFGILLYEMVAARLPFAAANAQQAINRILYDSADTVTRIHPGLERIIRKCMEKELSQRYHNPQANYWRI